LFNSKIIGKENSEYVGVFPFVEIWMFQNELIIQWTCVEMAKVLRYYHFWYFWFDAFPMRGTRKTLHWLDWWGTTTGNILNQKGY
jgi:hypothetical protein